MTDGYEKNIKEVSQKFVTLHLELCDRKGHELYAELQIRRGNRDNLEIIILISL